MLEEIIDKLVGDISPEILYTAACLTDAYGPALSVEQYSECFDIKINTVEKQISDETVAVKPKKIGRKNLFPVIEVAKHLHGA